MPLVGYNFIRTKVTKASIFFILLLGCTIVIVSFYLPDKISSASSAAPPEPKMCLISSAIGAFFYLPALLESMQ